MRVRTIDRSIDRSIATPDRVGTNHVEHPPRRPSSSCLPPRARSRAPSTSRPLRDRDRRRRFRRRPAPRRTTSGCPEAPGRSTSTEPPQGACERANARYRDVSSVCCVFFLNRDSSVSTREEGVDTFGRRSIGDRARRVDVSFVSGVRSRRIAPDRIKNRRRRVDEHSTNRRTRTPVDDDGRPRASVVADERTNERIEWNGWIRARR